MRRLVVLLACTPLSLGLASCGDDDDDPTIAIDEPAVTTDDGGSDTTEAETSDEIVAASTVQVAETDLGEVLVDEDQLTLYLFTNDSEGTSACNEGCVDAWPPLVVDGEPTAGDGVDESLLGTIEREDGSTQVTYDGHPLYTYAADQAPGDTSGHGVGDVWFAVGADGEALPA